MALRVQRPPLLAELDVGASVAPAWVGPAERAELLAQPLVAVWLDRLMALGGAVLPDQLARPPL